MARSHSLFYGCGVYTYRLYPFIHQWALRLFPCHRGCRWCCSEHGGACIFSHSFFMSSQKSLRILLKFSSDQYLCLLWLGKFFLWLSFLPYYNCKAGPQGHDGPPLLSSCQQGKSLTEGSSQIPRANDSTVRQLKQSPPQPRKGPISPQHLDLTTYRDPHLLTVPFFGDLARSSLIRSVYKPPPNTSGRDLPHWGLGTPPGSAWPLKPVRHSFWCPGRLLPNTYICTTFFILFLLLLLSLSA